MDLNSLKHKLVLTSKRLLYAKQGEPYQVGGKTLHFIPGTRPIRTKYATSGNANNMNDALQVLLFSEQIAEGDFVIDIGAHAGQYAILMSAFAGHTGKVISFEPDPYARRTLGKNLSLNPSIAQPTIEQYAVSDENGFAILFSGGGDSQSSLAMSGTSQKKDQEEITVETITLDSYLSKMNLGNPNWVKIDAEGAECSILKGATEVLNSDAKIVCELHPFAWAEFGTSFDEIKTVVERSGRRIVQLTDGEEMLQPEYATVLLSKKQ